MQRNFWQKLNRELRIWRFGALPGLLTLMLIIVARLNGDLQSLEWKIFDWFLRLRPPETQDERVVIIGINDRDLQQIKTYSLPDEKLIELIETLQSYQPRAIGLNLVRDIPIVSSHEKLVKALKANETIIGIEQPSKTIIPPSNLPPQQVGFSDILPDSDGKHRRSFLKIKTDETDYFSFPLRLAKTYLATEGLSLQGGIRDPDTLRFASTEFPRFKPNFGGYVETNARGMQVLINFRSGKAPFRVLSLRDIESGNFQPSWLKDRIILIGMRTQSVHDFVNTTVISGSNSYGLAYEIEYHAHAVSQIISAVKDDRPLLKSLSSQWEYLWIVAWGFLAIALGRITQSLLKNIIAIGLASICLFSISYSLLLWGWWVPVAPILFILGTGIGLSAFGFSQYHRALKMQIAERKQVMEKAFTEIHNGPLQTLAILSKMIQDRKLSNEELLSGIHSLDREIRGVGEYLTENLDNDSDKAIMIDGKKLDLNRPLHELFYEIYTLTIQRKFRHFKAIKVKVRDFDPIASNYLNLEQKRELCYFLEEALCNIGKHAEGVTRIIATGKNIDGCYVLSIKDNGIGCTPEIENKGTKQSKQLAKALKGQFKREALSPKGTLCELTWKLDQNQNFILRFLQRFKL